MGTPYEDIHGRFAMKTTDYRLDKLFVSSESAYQSFLNGFLTSAISKFKKCTKNLKLRDEDLQEFSITLDDDEIEILSELMVVEWASKEVHNIMEMKRHLNDTDFKLFSEAQNLKEKNNLLITTREYVGKLILDYGYDNLDMSLLEG
ncbi:hypothetical protein KY334_05455 [Candidatus Woesearchaeota archaeon]|nr:hypothetical protein [Candidatus Woesearchaeota archaeon]